MTTASGSPPHPFITTALDEFKHLCQQGLSLHSFGCFTFLGHLCMFISLQKTTDQAQFQAKIFFLEFEYIMEEKYHRRDLTFHFNCGICIWCHDKCVNTHVFPRIICPRFIDSTKKLKNTYFITFHSSVTYSVSREVNKVNQFQFNSSN